MNVVEISKQIVTWLPNFVLVAVLAVWVITFVSNGPTSTVPVAKKIVDTLPPPLTTARQGTPFPPPTTAPMPAPANEQPYLPGEEPYRAGAPTSNAIWTVWDSNLETLAEGLE